MPFYPYCPEKKGRSGAMSPVWKKRSLIAIALITSLVVAYNVYSNQAGRRFDEGLKKLEADAKGRLPIKVNEFTTLVDVTYEPHKKVYWYVMEVKDGERVERQKLKQRAQDQLCGNADALRMIKEKGVSYEYHYMDKARATIVVFTIADCP
jgi:hypothetical protein